MKLKEIAMSTTPGSKRFKLSDFDIANGKLVGTSEWGFLIYKIQDIHQSEYILYALFNIDKNNEFVAGVVGRMVGMYFTVVDSYTDAQYRNKGYMTALYLDLVKKYGIKIVSDESHTLYGRKLWGALRKTGRVKIYDTETKQLIPDDGTIPEDRLYSNYNGEDYRYRLVAEDVNYSIENASRIQYSLRLRDYMYYTSPYYFGQFV